MSHALRLTNKRNDQHTFLHLTRMMSEANRRLAIAIERNRERDIERLDDRISVLRDRLISLQFADTPFDYDRPLTIEQIGA